MGPDEHEIEAAQQIAATKEVRLPSFCTNDVPCWFRRAEIQFRIKKITSETLKADYVLAALPEETFTSVAGWLDTQPDEIPYKELKEYLLEKFTLTAEEKAKKLMAIINQPIGDQRPSQAMEEMERLIRLPTTNGEEKTMDVLLILWLHRLPHEVRKNITAFSEHTREELKKKADRLKDAAAATSSKAVAGHVCSSQEDDYKEENPINEENTAAATFNGNRPTFRKQTRPQQTLNPQPPRDIVPRKAAQSICFYHRRFGHEARRCLHPCSWTKNL